MKTFNRRPQVVTAVQITNRTFDDPHPNPEHIVGALYDPRSRTCAVVSDNGIVKAALNDWVVVFPDGAMRVFSDRSFRTHYEEAPE